MQNLLLNLVLQPQTRVFTEGAGVVFSSRLSHRSRFLRLLVGALALSAGTTALAQERFRPNDSAVVVPASVHAQGTPGALRDLDAAWRRNPQDLQAALDYARAVFLIGLTEGDLRWFGSARAALNPWWKSSDLPADGYFLRGLVKQGFHDFEAGLRDIDAAIGLERTRPEFWSWRLALHLLLADMPAAQQDCQEMGRLFGADELQACSAILLYRSGQPQQAAALLGQSVKAAAFQNPPAQDWLRFHWGEAQRVAGRPAQAISIWERHLQSRPQSHLVRLALVELLNQQGQHARAKQYAATPAPTDALLVQALLASQGLQDGDTARLAELFEGRLKNQARRQEALIERPRLIYLIRHGRDLAAGLALSIENWTLQKEPADAVLFVEAALRLNQPRAAAPVLAWAGQTGYTDPELAPLLQALQAHPRWTTGDRP